MPGHLLIHHWCSSPAALCPQCKQIQPVSQGPLGWSMNMLCLNREGNITEGGLAKIPETRQVSSFLSCRRRCLHPPILLKSTGTRSLLSWQRPRLLPCPTKHSCLFPQSRSFIKSLCRLMAILQVFCIKDFDKKKAW